MTESPVDTAKPTETPRAPRGPHVVVLDIPVDTSAEDMAQLIERHSGDFFLLSVLPWPGEGARAVFRKHALVARRERQASGEVPEYEHRDGKDKAALALLKAHRGTTLRRMSEILKANGIIRGTFRSWLDAVGTKVSVQQSLMRHSDIRMTMNTYGRVITDEESTAASKVAALAFANGALVERPPS